MSHSLRCVACCVLSVAAAALSHGAERRVVPVSALDQEADYVLEQGTATIVEDGPGQERVSRFDQEFVLRLDLNSRAIKPREFDTIRIQVKNDAHAFLVISLENFPQPGELSHWYVLDGARLEQGWRTICIDLNKPEEVKGTGTYKGMNANDPQARGLRIRGRVNELRQASQPPGRSLWLGPVRFVKKSLTLDWDQSQVHCESSAGQDLVCRYPLTVTNHLDRPVTTQLRIERTSGEQATAALSQPQLQIPPGETRKVEARLTLPATAAARLPPLTSERFAVIAEIPGEPDSQVTILRSSDPIPLSITVPIPEEKLQFPLLPRVSTIPDGVTGYSGKVRARATQLAKEVRPQDLELGANGGPGDPGDGKAFHYYKNSRQPRHDAGDRYREGVTACAFVFDNTGDRSALAQGTQLLLKAADLFAYWHQQWQDTPYSQISDGIFTRHTLALGWVTGSQRWPYSYERHGLFNDFDLLAKDMEPAARERIIREFLVPAAIQMRNHHIGLGNQQDVVNYPILYAGLAARNWPLVAFAYDSPHGVRNQIRYDFDDEGLASEGNYHKPALEPILNACELLLARGINLYDNRLFQMLHSRAAKTIKKSYDSPMLAFADQFRFEKQELPPAATSDGVHQTTGLTQLRWKQTEVSMNWGVHLNRSAPDRCALRINNLGGGMYTHSSLGQSVIIIDEGLQQPLAADVLGFDVDGPVQYVSAASDQHFPGSRIIRTFALIDGNVLVLDRVVNDKPRTVDWCLKGAGEKFSLKMQTVSGGFTDKADDAARRAVFGAHLHGNRHAVATTDTGWSEGDGRLKMAGVPGTQVFSFQLGGVKSSILMVRRAAVESTDFVAGLWRKSRAVEQAPVLLEDGTTADALGAVVTQADGKRVRVIVNFQPGTTVHLDDLKTTERFATDFQE